MKKRKKESRSASKLHKRKEEGLWNAFRYPFDSLSTRIPYMSFRPCTVGEQRKKRKKKKKIINYFCRFIFSSKFSYTKLLLFKPN